MFAHRSRGVKSQFHHNEPTATSGQLPVPSVFMCVVFDFSAITRGHSDEVNTENAVVPRRTMFQDRILARLSWVAVWRFPPLWSADIPSEHRHKEWFEFLDCLLWPGAYANE